MKIASMFIYCLFTILYLNFADGSMFMYALGQLTLLMFICILLLFVIQRQVNTYNERLFLKFCGLLTIGRVIYTSFCSFIDEDGWVIYNTDIFKFMLTTSFACFLIYIAYKNSKK